MREYLYLTTFLKKVLYLTVKYKIFNYIANEQKIINTRHTRMEEKRAKRTTLKILRPPQNLNVGLNLSSSCLKCTHKRRLCEVHGAQGKPWLSPLGSESGRFLLRFAIKRTLVEAIISILSGTLKIDAGQELYRTVSKELPCFIPRSNSVNTLVCLESQSQKGKSFLLAGGRRRMRGGWEIGGKKQSRSVQLV